MKRKLLSAVLVLLLTLSVCGYANAASYSAYFNTGTKVYRSASTSSASATISTGTKVTVTGINGNWARIAKNGKVAYCNVRFLTLSKPITAYIKTATQLYQSASTASTIVAKLDVNTCVKIVGRDGSYFRVTNKAGTVTGYVQARCVSGSKVAETTTTTVYNYSAATKNGKTVYAMDWFHGGSDVFAAGTYATIYDIKSGKSFNVKRMGGSNHGDLEPATNADAAILRAINGGDYSWDSRPVLLLVNGRYFACAINSMPHGDQTILDNDFDGQFCLHMINSRTHGTNTVNSNHQSSIKTAYKWAISNL